MVLTKSKAHHKACSLQDVYVLGAISGLDEESLTLAQVRGREKTYTECLLDPKHHTALFSYALITLSSKILQGGYNRPHVKKLKIKSGRKMKKI